MAKWGMVMDISRCIACYACFVACKDEYWNNDYPPYTAGQPRLGQFWMNLRKSERGRYPYPKVAYMPVPCQQCEKPACAKVAEKGAVYKTDEGIVVIDPQKAVGQKQIVDACPYDAIFWNEEKKLPQKCTLCAHRVKEGKQPRCVQSCPSEAIKFGNLDDPGSEVAKLVKSGQAEIYRPDLSPKNNVFYLDLHKITRKFVAGEVIFRDTDDCAKGVSVTLTGSPGRTSKTTSNAFGNFEFDGLDAGPYSIQIRSPGYVPKILDVDLKSDIYLGDIVLDKS